MLYVTTKAQAPSLGSCPGDAVAGPLQHPNTAGGWAVVHHAASQTALLPDPRDDTVGAILTCDDVQRRLKPRYADHVDFSTRWAAPVPSVIDHLDVGTCRGGAA